METPLNDKKENVGLPYSNGGLADIERDAERYRYLKSCFTNDYQLIEFARRLGCRADEFLPSMDHAIDAAMTANVGLRG